MKRLFLIATALACASVLRAQQFDNPVAVPLGVYVHTASNSTGNSGYINVSGVTSPSINITANGATGEMYSDLYSISLTPGKPYTVSATWQYFDPIIIIFTHSPGTDIYIDGEPRDTFVATAAQLSAGNAQFTVRVESINDLTQNLAGQRGGACSNFTEDKAIWYVGLGSLRSGAFAGAVGFRAASISSALWSPSSLIYDTVDASDVTVTRDASGYITKVEAPEVVLQTGAITSTSYQISAYAKSDLANPFAVYTVQQYAVSGGSGIRIDRAEDGINWSTALTQVGSTWTRYDWQRVTAGGSLDTSHISVATGDQINGISVSYGNGITSKQKSYAAAEMTSATMGPGVTPLMKTEYTYYSGTTNGAWPSMVATAKEPSGKWTKYEYYDTTDSTADPTLKSTAGQLHRLYHPWLDNTTDPTAATTANSYVETYTYGSNYDGNNSAMTDRTVTIAGTQVGHTSWSYNWGYATKNSHSIAQKIQHDYPSSSTSKYLTTTTLLFRPDDPSKYFSDKLYSVTYPTGRKDAYAYYNGTWTPGTSTFAWDTSPTAKNPDRLILVFHGQTTGGSTLSTWNEASTDWAVDDVHMVANVSTVSMSVIDATGRVVYSAEKVCKSESPFAFDVISATKSEFDGHNRPYQQTDLVRSLVTKHTYATTSAGAFTALRNTVAFTDTVDAPDGTETIYGYDGFERLFLTESGATGGGNYPAVLHVTKFNDADLAVATYVLPSGNWNTTNGAITFKSPTTFVYDAAGRKTYEYDKAPSDSDGDTQGTLSTHFEYPTATSRKVTYPTNAWRQDDTFVDGRPKSVSGTAAAPEQWSYAATATGLQTTHQNGTDLLNGFSIDQVDYIGRAVTHSSPTYQYSAANTNNIVDVSYKYDDDGTIPTAHTPTGNLLSTSTTYRANNDSTIKLVPDHVYQYDPIGQVAAEGLDLNNNGTLDTSSNDRFTAYTRQYVNSAGWKQQVITESYGALGSAAKTQVSKVETRLTGFSGSIAEVVSYDGFNNTTTETTTIDPANLITTVTTKLADSSGSAYVSNALYRSTKNGYDYETGDFSGQRVRKSYDSLGRLVQTQSRSTTTTSNGVTTTSFAATDTSAYWNYTSYPSSTSSGGISSSYVYAWDTGTNTRSVTATDASGNSTYTRYNAMGLVDRVGGAAASAVEFGYDGLGRKIRMTAFRSGGPYDGSNWPAQSAGDSTKWTLDPATSLLVSKAYPADNVNQHDDFDYYPTGKLKTRTAAGIGSLNTRVTATYTYYDGSGTATSTDVSYRTQELASIAYSDGTAGVTYTYNRTGLADTVTDATGKHKFVYGANPFQLQSEAFQGGYYGGTTNAYRLLTTTYDSYQRVIGFKLGNEAANSAAADLTQSYGFDPVTGAVQTVSSAIGSGTAQVFTYAYAQVDTSLPSGYSTTYNSTTYSAVIGYEGANGTTSTSASRRTQSQGKWGSSVVTQFDVAYDSRGSVQYSKQSGSAFSDYWSGTTYNSVYDYYYYDGRRQLNTAVKYRNTPPSSGVPSPNDEFPGRRYEYRYDGAGNRLTAGYADPAGAGAGANQVYSTNKNNQYDHADNKVVHITGTAAANATVTVGGPSGDAAVTKLDRVFGADLVPSTTGGNVTISSALAGVVASSTRPWKLGSQSEALTHDYSGNLISDELWTYTYDAESRLTTMIPTSAGIAAGIPNQKIRFVYDYLNRRVSKSTATPDGSGGWNPATETRYLYNGWNLVAEINPSNSTLSRSYTWGLDVAGSFSATAGVGALLLIHDYSSGANYQPTYDVAGNVSTLLDTTSGAGGTVVALYEYSPYGELVRWDGDSIAKKNPFRYSTRYTDDETGLIYYGNRLYSPARGRFLNRDRNGEAGGNNLYAFVGNNPVSGIDILGNGPGSPGSPPPTPPELDGGTLPSFGTSVDKLPTRTVSQFEGGAIFLDGHGGSFGGFGATLSLDGLRLIPAANSMTGASRNPPTVQNKPGLPTAKEMKAQQLRFMVGVYKEMGNALGMAKAAAALLDLLGLPADPVIDDYIESHTPLGQLTFWQVIKLGLSGPSREQYEVQGMQKASGLLLNMAYGATVGTALAARDHWNAGNDAYLHGDNTMMFLYTLRTFGDVASLGLVATGAYGGVRGLFSSAAESGPLVVNEETIRAALEGSTMKTAQDAVSIPAIERYVRMLEAGSDAPAIRVAEDVIVDGNHRYIAGRVFGQEPVFEPGSLPSFKTDLVKPIQEIKLDPTDWGNH